MEYKTNQPHLEAGQEGVNTGLLNRLGPVQYCEWKTVVHLINFDSLQLLDTSTLACYSYYSIFCINGVPTKSLNIYSPKRERSYASADEFFKHNSVAMVERGAPWQNPHNAEYSF